MDTLPSQHALFLDDEPYSAQKMYSTTSQDDLVGSLKNRLVLSRSKLHAWVEEQKAVCETVTNRYRADKRTYQDQIDAKLQSLVTWKLEKGLNISGEEQSPQSDSDEQQEVEQAMKESIQKLKNKVKTQKQELEELKLEKTATEEASSQAQPSDESDHPTKDRFDELQSIIKGYQELSGLSFEKAENERLRFFFQGLDKKERDRQCTFLLSTSPDDLYLVEDCQPPVPQEQLTELVDELNESEDLGKFFQGLRSVWSLTILEETNA